MIDRPDSWDELIDARLAGDIDDIEWNRMLAAFGEGLDRALAEERVLRAILRDIPSASLPPDLRRAVLERIIELPQTDADDPLRSTETEPASPASTDGKTDGAEGTGTAPERGKIVVLATAATSLLAAAVLFAILPQLLPFLHDDPAPDAGEAEQVAYHDRNTERRARRAGSTPADPVTGDQANRDAEKNAIAAADGTHRTTEDRSSAAGQGTAAPAVQPLSPTDAADAIPAESAPDTEKTRPPDRPRSRPAFAFGDGEAEGKTWSGTERGEGPAATAKAGSRAGRLGSAGEGQAEDPSPRSQREGISEQALRELVAQAEDFDRTERPTDRTVRGRMLKGRDEPELGVRFLLTPEPRDAPRLQVELRNRSRRQLTLDRGSLRLEGLDAEGRLAYRLVVEVPDGTVIAPSQTATFGVDLKPEQLPGATIDVLRLAVADRRSATVAWPPSPRRGDANAAPPTMLDAAEPASEATTIDPASD